MKTIQILEDGDLVQGTDWCRPLFFQSMSGGHSDHYSFESEYSGLPTNNAKWVKVEDVFGSCWFGKPAIMLQSSGQYEFARGDVPRHHRLRVHKSLAKFLATLKPR